MEFWDVEGGWKDIKLFYRNFKPVLKKHGLRKADRRMAFQILCARQFDRKLTWQEECFDQRVLLKECHIDTVLCVPPKYRRNWLEQPD